MIIILFLFLFAFFFFFFFVLVFLLLDADGFLFLLLFCTRLKEETAADADVSAFYPLFFLLYVQNLDSFFFFACLVAVGSESDRGHDGAERARGGAGGVRTALHSHLVARAAHRAVGRAAEATRALLSGMPPLLIDPLYPLFFFICVSIAYPLFLMLRHSSLTFFA